MLDMVYNGLKFIRRKMKINNYSFYDYFSITNNICDYKIG
jgi:hypothetical protein